MTGIDSERAASPAMKACASPPPAASTAASAASLRRKRSRPLAASSSALRIKPLPSVLIVKTPLTSLLHQLHEPVEQAADVVRTGAGFRVALEAKRRPVRVTEPLQAAVEQGPVGELAVGRQGGRVY